MGVEFELTGVARRRPSFDGLGRRVTATRPSGQYEEVVANARATCGIPSGNSYSKRFAPIIALLSL